jgi:SpoU rRNA methylase family enzyme
MAAAGRDGVTRAQRVVLRAEYEVVEIDQLEDSHAV